MYQGGELELIMSLEVNFDIDIQATNRAYNQRHIGYEWHSLGRDRK